jgi:hypothetical protein
MADNEAEAGLTEALRKTMQAHPSAQVDFSRPELFSLSPPLEIEVEGSDLEGIRVAGAKLAAMLRANPHYADVKSTVEQGFPEIQIVFDQDRAAALGLTTRQIADVVVKKVRGEVATRYSFRDRKIDVLVRAQESDRASVDDIRRLIVNPGSGAPVTLDAVAAWSRPPAPARSIAPTRRRVAIISPTCATAIWAARPRSRSDGREDAAGHRHRHAHRRPGRGARRIHPLAAVRVRPGDFPGLPGDGLAVRIAAASVRDPVHHPAGTGGRGRRVAADHRHRCRWWCSSD